MTDVPELTADQLKRAIPARLRRRLVQGRFESGADIAALRRFIGLTQIEFARAVEISVHTLRNWEQDIRKPEGPALDLLKTAARHPRIIREQFNSAARRIGIPPNIASTGETPRRRPVARSPARAS